jgi:predicted transcriptional regulator of viral defense system
MSKKLRGKRKEIYEVIKKSKKTSLGEIRESTNINHNTIRSAVIGLTKAGLIERIDRGTYKAK